MVISNNLLESQSVGQGEYLVKAGDCISSIAMNAGHFWKILWDDPANAELRRVRGNPNVLRPGDRVHIRPLEMKQESGATGQRHRFRRKGEPSLVRIVLYAGSEPRANQDYILEIDGKLTTGTTGSNGELEIWIPGNAKRGKLIIGPDQEEFPLELGTIDPIDTVTGIQGRLNNLGFDAGIVDGKLNSQTQAALRNFQKKYGLPESGEPDKQTRSKLLEVHGC